MVDSMFLSYALCVFIFLELLQSRITSHDAFRDQRSPGNPFLTEWLVTLTTNNIKLVSIFDLHQHRQIITENTFIPAKP